MYSLSTPTVIERISKLTGIESMEYDKTLHGAGLHMHGSGGQLMLHLDYEKHPILENKQRQINIILYLSKSWNPSWNGATEMWDEGVLNKIKESPVIFNNALIFQGCEKSWHGVPEPIMCPPGEYRKTLAYYYITPLVNRADDRKVGSNPGGFREKATFTLRPHDEEDLRVMKLLSIRSHRRLTEDDLNDSGNN